MQKVSKIRKVYFGEVGSNKMAVLGLDLGKYIEGKILIEEKRLTHSNIAYCANYFCTSFALLQSDFY